MFISPAYAQSADAGGGDILGMMLPLVLIMGVFWFLLIRPQQKKMKLHQEMVANLRRGDTVVTSGGVIGKIARVHEAENEILLDVGENVKMRFQSNSVSEVRVKGEPAKSDSKTADSRPASKADKKADKKTATKS